MTNLEDYLNGIGGPTEAARKLGVDKATVYRWLSGSVETPPLMNVVLKLSNKLVERDQQYQELMRIKNQLKMTVKQLNKELEELKNDWRRI